MNKKLPAVKAKWKLVAFSPCCVVECEVDIETSMAHCDDCMESFNVITPRRRPAADTAKPKEESNG